MTPRVVTVAEDGTVPTALDPGEQLVALRIEWPPGVLLVSRDRLEIASADLDVAIAEGK